MRKKLNARKLSVRTQTIRKLVDSEMEKVAGGRLSGNVRYCSSATVEKCGGYTCGCFGEGWP